MQVSLFIHVIESSRKYYKQRASKKPMVNGNKFVIYMFKMSSYSMCAYICCTTCIFCSKKQNIFSHLLHFIDHCGGETARQKKRAPFWRDESDITATWPRTVAPINPNHLVTNTYSMYISLLNLGNFLEQLFVLFFQFIQRKRWWLLAIKEYRTVISARWNISIIHWVCDKKPAGFDGGLARGRHW